MNIFQISQELLDIFAELEENGGELTEDLEAQLAISQADFKTKVKSYGDVIKYTESEIDLIDKEIARLKDLKESKKKAITRLEKIIIWAVNMFGEETKSGGKFIDFGTGKISVRNSEKVEVNTDVTDLVVKNFFSYFNMLNYTKELNNYSGIDCKDCVTALKEMENPVEITEDELYNIQTSLTLDVNLRDLLTGEGFEFTRHFLKFVSNYKAKSSVSKTILKDALKEGNVDLHNIAELVKNQTITIK